MTVATNNVTVYAGGTLTPTAPLVEGTAASSLTTSGIDLASVPPAGRYGGRFTFGAAIDFTTHPVVSFGVISNQFSPATNIETVANGGLRIVFIDGSGNYSGFNIYGSGVPNYNPSNNEPEDGFWIAFATTTQWHIHRSHSPDISSGTLNWANVTAVEITIRTTSAVQKQMQLQRVVKRDAMLVTGTETLATVQAASNAILSTTDSFFFSRARRFLFGNSSIAYSSRIGLTVGNGSSTTNFTNSNFSLGFENTFDKSPAYVSVGPWIQLDGSNTRNLLINQSSTDVLSLSDGSIASAAWWQWVLQGSGTATCSRVQFWRYNQFLAAHGAYTDCIWDGGEAAVEIGTSTVLTRATIRNCTNGIKILSAAGTYTGTITFSNQSTYDIECGSGGAGTYNLPNISVVGAYTLKIRNNSATNSITVAIPSGIAFSTSTAGGTIAVSTPPTYQSVTVNGLVSGSRLQIYDTTSSTELANVTTGTSYTWTDAVPASASRAIRVRIAYQSGVTAKLFIEANIGTAGTGGSDSAVTYLANQSDDTVYIANGVNGSLVSGITISDGIDRLVINIGGGSVSWPQIYAYNVYWLTTSAGIVDDGSIITAVDTANYRVSLFKIRNSSATPLNITGGYGVDASTGTVAPLIDVAGSTGNIYQTPEHVVAYQTTGTYAITGDIATVLTAVSNVPANVLSAASATPIAANVEQVNSQTITGTGTTIDPWGP